MASAGWAAACPVGPGGRGRRTKPRDAGGSGRAGAAGLGGERVQVGPLPDPTAAQTRTWWVGVVPSVTPLLRPQSWTQAAEDPEVLCKSGFGGRWAARSGGGERPWCESGQKLTFGAEGRGPGEGRILPCVPPGTHPRGPRQSGFASTVPVCVHMCVRVLQPVFKGTLTP